MSKDNMTICLEDFLTYIVKKWRFVLLLLVVSATVFFVVATKAENEICVEPSEEYLYLFEQKEAMDNYMENSIIMKMDAQNVYKIYITIENIHNREMLKEYITSGAVWENLKEKPELEYLKETIVWSNGKYEETAELLIRHWNQEICDRYAEYVLEQLSVYDKTFEVIVGKQKLESDDSALMIQLGKLDLKHKIESQLEVAAAGYTIRISSVAAATVGMFFGGMISVVYLLFEYVLKEKRK